jgi:hypothetical protein
MGIFDKQVRRRPPKGNEGGLDLEDLGDVREEVPEVTDALANIQHALDSEMTQGGCGCWG